MEVMKENKEIRSCGGQLRAVSPEGEGRTIEFYPIVFNKESRLLYDYWQDRSFKEVIKPEALSAEFLATQDIKCNVDHNNSRLLGRSVEGKGTLRMEIDETGLKCELDLPNTATGDEILELVKRGDVFGCSFAFSYDKNKLTTTKRQDGTYYREVSGFEAIYDVSIVVDPAYLDTTVYKRDFEQVIADESGKDAWRADAEYLQDLLSKEF